MRFLLVIAVWAVIITAVLTLFSIRAPQAVGENTDVKPMWDFPVSIEVTTTFDVEEDPFALQIDNEKSAFSVSLNGELILNKSEGIKDRQTIDIEKLMLPNGNHEIFIKANPANSGLKNAVRIRVLYGSEPLTDATYWFQSGEIVSAAHRFTMNIQEGHHDQH